MRVTTFLATALFLCSVGFAVSEPMNQISGLQHILTKRQTTCTQEQVETFNSNFDLILCITNSNMLGQSTEQFFNSSGPPDQELIDEVNQLIGKVCADTCIGGIINLLQECTPDEDDFGDLEDILDTLRFLCNSNGRFFCVLAPTKITNFTAFDLELNTCPSVWVDSENDTCLPQCQTAHDTVVNDIGCCINNYFDVILSDYNVTTQDYYSACNLQDPGDCSIALVDRNGGTFTTAAKVLSILAVLIGIAVSIF